MLWTNDAGLFVVAGVSCVIATLIIGDRVKLPGGLEFHARKEARMVLGVLGVGLLVWGGVLAVS